MNKALPSPQPARKPMIWLIVCDDPASALEENDQGKASDQGPPTADPTRNPAGDQHGNRRHHEIAREEQLDRAR